MPRWLIASILAIVLSCYGFSALAQTVVGVHAHAHGQPQDSAQSYASATVASVPATDEETPFSDAIDAATGHSEAGSDHAEAVDGFHRISGPERRSETPAKPLLTVTPSPFLERPKRPPRSARVSA